jgi:uncharacterized protein YjiS (DUF1127 family)
MRQADCTHPIARSAMVPTHQPGLVWLWRAWLASRLAGVPDLLLLWSDRARQRRRLYALDDRMLRDMGIDRAAAWSEAQKWFWQP